MQIFSLQRTLRNLYLISSKWNRSEEYTSSSHIWHKQDTHTSDTQCNVACTADGRFIHLQWLFLHSLQRLPAWTLLCLGNAELDEGTMHAHLV